MKVFIVVSTNSIQTIYKIAADNPEDAMDRLRNIDHKLVEVIGSSHMPVQFNIKELL